MEELYFTIAGCSHYFGSDFMEKGMKVKLEKSRIMSTTKKQYR